MVPAHTSVCSFVSSKMSYGHPYQYNPDHSYGSTPTTPASFVAWDLQEQDASFPPPPLQDANPAQQQPQAINVNVNPGIPTVPIPQRVSASTQGLFRLRDYVHQPSVEPPTVGEDDVDRLHGASGASTPLPGPQRSAPVREARAAHPYRRSSGSEGVAQRLRRGVHEPSSSGSQLRVSIPAIIGPTAITLPCPGQQHTASVGVPPASGPRYALLLTCFSLSSGPTWLCFYLPSLPPHLRLFTAPRNYRPPLFLCSLLWLSAIMPSGRMSSMIKMQIS